MPTIPYHATTSTTLFVISFFPNYLFLHSLSAPDHADDDRVGSTLLHTSQDPVHVVLEGMRKIYMGKKISVQGCCKQCGPVLQTYEFPGGKDCKIVTCQVLCMSFLTHKNLTNLFNRSGTAYNKVCNKA